MKRRTTIVFLNPRHEPTPKGWRKVGSAGRHRDHHVVLIQKLRNKRKARA